MEFSAYYINILMLYFPLGVIGLWRWSIWMYKRIVASRFDPRYFGVINTTLSIVVPVYNEDPDIFIKALKSWEENNPEEVIAVIDYTDTTCIKAYKEFQQINPNAKLIVTHRPGKREALADGIRIAKSDIIALVDSDTIWDPYIKNKLLAPFSDPEVGGAGPRQDVYEKNTLARKLFNIHLDHRYFDEMTYLATVGNALTCISGRTALYRRYAIEHLPDQLEGETFMGVKCISGDDKCLTRLVQENGWKVKYQPDARVRTPGAPDLPTFFKQQMRWTRNSFRSDIKSLRGKWIWKREKLLALYMLDRFIQPFTLLLGPIFFGVSVWLGHWIVALVLIIWWHLSRGIKLYPHLKSRPSDIFNLPAYILTTYIIGIIKIHSLLTLAQQGWETRWDKSRSERHMVILKRLASVSATLAIIVVMAIAVITYKDIALNKSLSDPQLIQSGSLSKPSLAQIESTL